MYTQAQLMLEACRLVTVVYDGTATGGTTSTLLDTNQTDKQGTYNGGTLWVLSGTNAGKCLEVKTQAVGAFTLKDTLTATIAAGNTYAVAEGTFFPKWLLKQAVNHVLKTTDVLNINTTHSASAGECTLTSISDIRRVLVDGEINYHWEERGGKIIFDDENKSGDLTLYYMAPSGDLATEQTEIPGEIDPNYVIWAAAEYLWRNYIHRKVNDRSKYSLAMKAEAQANAQTAAQMKRKYALDMPRDPRYSRWSK